LHVLAESLDDAHCVLTAALQAGFRESGAVNIASKGLPMVAVRSVGLGFDSVIGYQDASESVFCIVGAAYLSNMVRLAKNRFETNTERTKRFQVSLDNAYKARRRGGSAEELALEKELRRRRKREDGLAAQKEARKADGDQRVKDMPALASLCD
jgi:tRNA wybutosine-synthesizing protein 3